MLSAAPKWTKVLYSLLVLCGCSLITFNYLNSYRIEEVLLKSAINPPKQRGTEVLYCTSTLKVRTRARFGRKRQSLL